MLLLKSLCLCLCWLLCLVLEEEGCQGVGVHERVYVLELDLV